MPNSAATESQQSLPLHRVLEDEYMNLHGPLPEGYPWSFIRAHIEDPLVLIVYLHRKSDALSDLLQQQLIAFIKAHSPSPETLTLLEQYLNQIGIGPPIKAPDSLSQSKILRNALVSLLNSKLEEDTWQKLCDRAEVEDAKRLAAAYLPYNNQSLVNRLLLEKSIMLKAFPVQNAERESKDSRKILMDKLDVSWKALLKNLKDETDSEKIKKAKEQWLEEQYLSAIYGLIHERQSSALCLSGGGIRSATFNLGILQGLARKMLIGEFHYLSTVSGGGYIGSWLSAWIHRHPKGVRGVMHELGEKPLSALEPDSPEIDHLRTYSNYLSPQTGLLSADTWTLAATVLRNLFLNWMVFIPLLLAALMVPRIYVAAIRRWTNDLWEPWSLAAGFILALIGVTYVGLYLPSKDNRKSNQNRFLVQCLTPTVLAAIAITFFWARFNDGTRWHGWATYLGIDSSRDVLVGFMILVSLLILIGYAFYVYSRRGLLASYIEDSYRLQNKNVTGKVAFFIGLSVVVVVVAGSACGYLLWKLSSEFPQSVLFEHTRTYAVFAVPLLMGLLMLAATLLLGLTSRGNSDEEQEWFARFSGWILIVTVSWIVISGLVLSSADMADKEWITKVEISPLLKSLAAILGVLSGIFTVLGGFSSKTPAYIQREGSANVRCQGKKGLGVMVRKSLTALAAPVFLVFLVVVFALATNILLSHLSPRVGRVLSVINVDYQQTDLLQFAFHRDIIIHSGLRLLLVTFALLGLFGWFMGLLIDTGKFSIHSMYANRLKRAYLGASRKNRRANWFTNFDSADDMRMHELRPALFNERSFKDLPGLIDELNNSRDQLSNDIRNKLSPTTKSLMQTYKPTSDPSPELRHALIQDLNNTLLEGDYIYIEERYETPKEDMAKITREMLKQDLQGEARVLLNRLYLEEVYPDKIEKVGDELKEGRLGRPLHVVNMALNLMRGDRLAWQERKAETFTVSPLHSGNHMLGYRRSRYYGGDNGVSLGTAFTISGAAASPNMGYMLASPLVSFLMAMFNVRLGWWLGNPGEAGDKTFGRAAPKFTLGPIISEALSMSDDKSRYVYLSDGGHFENLGLYEMVLRRCHLIVVSDASTDPDYKFDSLGMALRKIRIDLGIPIVFGKGFNIHTGQSDKESRYLSVGTIRYSCVDDDCTDGVLIYIKASLSHTDEPRDVLHYHQEKGTFPQEFIGDQWFSESQFESYRALGSHIVDKICNNRDKVWFDVATFEEKVREYAGQSADDCQP